jgi:hypothetical protein
MMEQTVCVIVSPKGVIWQAFWTKDSATRSLNTEYSAWNKAIFSIKSMPLSECKALGIKIEEPKF